MNQPNIISTIIIWNLNKTWTLGDARMERWEVDEGIRGDKEVGEKSAEILLHSIYDDDDDDSPDDIEVTKKDTAKGDTEDKNVSSHRVITFWWPWSWLSAVIRNQNDQEIHLFKTTLVSPGPYPLAKNSIFG